MTTLGKLLVPYQHPALLLDTSWLVAYSQHRQGALSMLASASQSILERSGGMSFSAIVPEWVDREYRTMHDNHATDEYGIPKTTAYFGAGMKYSEAPRNLPEIWGSAWFAWKNGSDKAVSAKWLKTADHEILACATEMAENGRDCFILAYDDDISGAIMKAPDKYITNVHMAIDKWMPPEDAIRFAIDGNHDNRGSVMLLTPDAAGAFYSIPEGDEITHCLITVSAPFPDRKREVGIAVRPITTGHSSEYNDIQRYPIFILDATRAYDEGTGRLGINLGRLKQRNERMFKNVAKRYPMAFEAVGVTRSSKYGMMDMVVVEKKMFMEQGVISRSIGQTAPDWVLIDNRYMRAFCPEAAEVIASARKHLQE